MDKTIQQKYWNKKRLYQIGGISILLLLLGTTAYMTLQQKSYTVPADRIRLFSIKEDIFQEFIPLQGTVLPIHSIFLDATVGGRVEEKFVEDGVHLKQGDPIMRLSNSDLELSLVNQETSVLNLLTQSQIAQINAQQVSINNRNQLADVENALRDAERQFVLNKKLLSQQAIGSQEYTKSFNEYNYQKERMELTKKILQQDSLSTHQKAGQDLQLYKRTQAALALLRQKVGDLIIRAPIDGRLTSFDSEIGQNKTVGERLGQIDVLSGFKIRAAIDEHYISRIYPDQLAEVLINNERYTLKIKKVYSQVSDGRFQVDLSFTSNIPPDIRRGQTLPLKLSLSEATRAMQLGKGGFYQQTGGNWIFKLSADGKKAYRTDIELGRQNPNFYEVISGLEVGDRVIISSYESFEKAQELNLSN